MARIHEAIVARADAHGLGGLLGTPPRIFPTSEVQQNAVVPYVSFQQVSGARDHTMHADKLALPRIQFDCFASTRLEALDIRDQILAAFDRWSGAIAGITVQSSVVESDAIDVDRDDVTLFPREMLEFAMSYVLP